MITIRVMQEGDIKKIAKAGKLMHAEGVFSNFEYDEQKVERMVHDYWKDSNKLALVATFDDGVNKGKPEIVGWFLAHLGNHYFGGSSLAIEQNMYIHPLHRGGLTAYRFMRKFDHWARHSDADVMLFMPCNNGVRDGWGKFAKQHGYTQTGYIFQKDL
jgi:hypothetical protein